MARAIGFLLPVIAWVIFRILDKHDFTPFSCTLLNVNCPVANSSGFVAPNFSKIRQLFEDNFANGDDIGAGVAIYVDGELKVNLAGGYMDRESGKRYTNETLQIVWSCTKAMVSYINTMLDDSGKLRK
jgi:CubicO group peptidase (beta-lactamase class C family)